MTSRVLYSARTTTHKRRMSPSPSKPFRMHDVAGHADASVRSSDLVGPRTQRGTFRRSVRWRRHARRIRAFGVACGRELSRRGAGRSDQGSSGLAVATPKANAVYTPPRTERRGTRPMGMLRISDGDSRRNMPLATSNLVGRSWSCLARFRHPSVPMYWLEVRWYGGQWAWRVLAGAGRTRGAGPSVGDAWRAFTTSGARPARLSISDMTLHRPDGQSRQQVCPRGSDDYQTASLVHEGVQG
jgi:hypothetical protein